MANTWGDIMANDFYFGKGAIESPSNENFQLHIHQDYEILLFLEGDTKYIIEENVYTLEPGDVVVIRKNQMHRAFHNSPARYDRIVLNVPPEFFEKNGCREYEQQFINKVGSFGDKIDAETVKSSGLYDAFMRAQKYSEGFGKNVCAPVVRAIIIEILHILNNINSYSEADKTDGQLKEIIKYLNANFTQNITLSELEERFFISKYHLCHIFPKATGITVHQYITNKRMALAEDMIKEGRSVGESALVSGFNSYSSFYRAYVQKYGKPPKQKRST